MDDAFMDEQLLIANEKEQERAEEAQKQADYANAMAKWRERCQMICDAGFPMSCAGDKPLLYQIKARNYSSQSNIPPNLDENSLKIPRERIRCPHGVIDLTLGKEIDIGNIDC